MLAEKGEYSFKDVPTGKYLLQAVNENSNLKLHLTPKFVEVEVGKDTLQLKEEFKISGFTVSGKVLRSSGGAPLKSAIVKLNNEKVAETDDTGSYTLENIKAGSYNIEIESPKLQFEPLQVKTQISTPTLPVIVPSAYEVCGKVVSLSHTSWALRKPDPLSIQRSQQSRRAAAGVHICPLANTTLKC